jgi:nucleotide-binding universal stress UspA family protein
VVLLYVRDPEAEPVAAFKTGQIEEKLIALATTACEKYNLQFYPHVSEGNVSEVIAGFSAQHYARMIIMGNNSNDISSVKRSTGLHAGKIIRTADCPVMTINSEIMYDLNKILLPLDLSKPHELKLNWAVYFAGIFGSIIKVVCIVPEHEKNLYKNLDCKMQRVKNVLNESNVFCTTEIIATKSHSASFSTSIVEYSGEHDCDLIMVMTRQEDKNNEADIGMTASGIISLSEKPVISITPKGRRMTTGQC